MTTELLKLRLIFVLSMTSCVNSLSDSTYEMKDSDLNNSDFLNTGVIQNGTSLLKYGRLNTSVNPRSSKELDDFNKLSSGKHEDNLANDDNKDNDQFSNEMYTENYNMSFTDDEDPGDPTTEEFLEFIYPKSWTWALIFFHCVVFVVGLVGNCLVCVAVYRNHTMRTVTNYFIVNLAVADFLVILFCLPPSVVWDVTSTWWFGAAMCKIVLYLQVSVIDNPAMHLITRFYAMSTLHDRVDPPQKHIRYLNQERMATVYLLGLGFKLLLDA